jgi:GNAT superfamily N-acetyltransferase
MNPIKRLSELVEDWYFLIQRDGLKSAIPVVGLDIARLPYRHLSFLILARSLVEPLPELQPKMPLEIRPFEKTDLKLIREINRPSEAGLCARRLVRRHFGFIAMNHAKAAGYAWGCDEIDPQLERVPLRLEHGDILCNDAFTTPTYRGQGVQTALTLARLHLFQELGYQRALCYIENRNSPSISVWQLKLNSSIIGRMDFKRFGPWHKVKFSDWKM